MIPPIKWYAGRALIMNGERVAGHANVIIVARARTEIYDMLEEVGLWQSKHQIKYAWDIHMPGILSGLPVDSIPGVYVAPEFKGPYRKA